MSQQAVIEFLKDPATYGGGVATVDVRQTHGSWVCLAGPRAYKLKKAVDLGFFDYSTLAKRRHFCEEEVRLNQRLAPRIYLGVRSVREESRRLRLAAPGDDRGVEVECLVEMERLPDDVLLDHRLAAGVVTRADLEALVEILARFYRQAARGAAIDRFGEPERIRRNVLENFEQTRSYVGETLDRLRFAAIRSAQLSFLALKVDLLARRIADGWIRDGHGDLRAEHVAFVPEPVVIDCIEFADRFRYGDVASDLAFLMMDLEFLGHADHAATLSRLYEHVAGDQGFREVIDFYASYRAYVRGKVDGMKLRQGGMDAPGRMDLERRVRRHFELAHFHTLAFHQPLCLLVGGLSGTGKSTLARSLATELGATLVRSDEVRKELVGLAPSARQPTPRAAAGFEAGIYSPDVTEATYAALGGRAAELLGAGATVVLDATFSKREERRAMQKVARDTGARFVHFECQAPPEVAARRMAERARDGRDASDAGPEIQAAQKAAYEPTTDAVRLDATGTPEDVVGRAMLHLRQAE